MYNNTINTEAKTSFLTKQVTVKARNNAELVQLLKKAFSTEAVQIILTPRVDVAGNAYYWIGIRLEKAELDFKLLVNKQIQNYILAYLKGDEEFPEITDYTPESGITDVDTWLATHESEHGKYAKHSNEGLNINETGSFIRKKLIFEKGKVIYPATEVEDALSLLRM